MMGTTATAPSTSTPTGEAPGDADGGLPLWRQALAGVIGAAWIAAASAELFSGWGPAWLLGSGPLVALGCWLVSRGGNPPRGRTPGALGALAALVLWYTLGRTWAESPAGASWEAGELSMLLAAAIVGWSGSRAGSIARGLVVWACVLAAGWVVGDVGLPLIEDGLPDFSAMGRLASSDATAACAAITLVGALSLLTSQRLPLRCVGALLSLTAGLGFAATASRFALVAAILGCTWLVWGRARRLEDAVALALLATFVNLSALLLPGGGWPLALPVAIVAAAFAALLPMYVQTARFATNDRDLQEARAQRGKSKRRLVIRRGLVALGIVFAVVVVVASSREQATTILDDPSAAKAETAVDFRRLWWEESLDGWQDAPLVGEGGQAFRLHSRVTVDKFLPTDDPHSTPLKVMQETGLVGLALLAAVVWFAGGGMRRLRRAASPDNVAWRQLSLGGAIAVTVGAQAAVDHTMSRPLLLILCGAGLGLALGWSRTSNSSGRFGWLAGIGIATALLPALIPAAGVGFAKHADNLADDNRRSSLEAADRAWEILPDASRLDTLIATKDRVDGHEDAKRLLEHTLKGDAAKDRDMYLVAERRSRTWGDSAFRNDVNEHLLDLDPAQRAEKRS